jgi:hypothetical protein
MATYNPASSGIYKTAAPAPIVNKTPVPTPIAGVNQAGTYYPTSTQTSFEKSAGVSAPDYYSSLGANGQLKSPFQVDPSQSATFKAMQDNAMSTELSPWAKMQQQALDASTLQQRDQSNAQQMGANDTALQSLALTGGGTNAGSRALTAAMGEKANIMANQNIGSQSAAQNLSIQQADAQSKAAMLGQVANTETGAQAANAGTANQDLSNENQFASNRYTQQMQAWGAAKTADAQRAAAGGGGGKK